MLSNCSGLEIESILAKRRDPKENMLFVLFDPTFFYMKKKLVKSLLYFIQNTVIYVDKINNINNLPFKVEDVKATNIIYIRLPKENIYTLSSNFAEKYLWSIIREFILLLVDLHANHIMMSYSTDSELSKKICLPTIQSILETKNISTHISEKRNTITHSFDLVNNGVNEITNSTFLSSKSFYYLKFRYDWIHLLVKRLDFNIVKDSYCLRNIYPDIFSRNLQNILNTTGIKNYYQFDRIKNDTIFCKIHYNTKRN